MKSSDIKAKVKNLLAEKEICVNGIRAQQLADAISSTYIKILKLTLKESLSISTIAKRLGLSEPYISERVRVLEDLNIVNIKYEKGKRGTRKIISSDLKRIIISLTDEET